MEINYFSYPQAIPNKIQKIMQKNFTILFNKYHLSNRIKLNEQDKMALELFKLYKKFANPNNCLDICKVKNFIINFHQWLYEKGHLQFKVFFHVEKSISLTEATLEWNTVNREGNRCFQVSPHETFFYSIEQIGLPVLNPNTIISILVLPSEKFDDTNMNYINKTDYSHIYELMQSQNGRSKLKCTFIGDCTYYLDPACRLVSIKLGDNQPSYVINTARHLQLDIAITKNPEISLDKVIENYVQTLRAKADVKTISSNLVLN